MTAPMTLEELAERVDATVAEAKRIPSLDAARAALNESGLQRARAVLRDAPAILSHAQDVFRSCQEAERRAKGELEDATFEVEWGWQRSCFEVRSNKIWLVADVDGTTVPANDQQSLTADERKDWLAYHARRAPSVMAATEKLRKAEAETAAARDAVGLAEDSVKAARADLDGAIAHVRTLSLCLGGDR